MTCLTAGLLLNALKSFWSKVEQLWCLIIALSCCFAKQEGLSPSLSLIASCLRAVLELAWALAELPPLCYEEDKQQLLSSAFDSLGSTVFLLLQLDEL